MRRGSLDRTSLRRTRTRAKRRQGASRGQVCLLSTSRSQQKVGEFLAGNDLSTPATFARRIGIGLLTGTIVTFSIVSAYGLDEVLEHFGITKPSYALKNEALNALDKSELAESLLGKPILADSAAGVQRQALVQPLADAQASNTTSILAATGTLLQRVKFAAIGPNGRANVFAEGDINGKPTFVALEMTSMNNDEVSTTEMSVAQAPVVILGELSESKRVR